MEKNAATFNSSDAFAGQADGSVTTETMAVNRPRRTILGSVKRSLRDLYVFTFGRPSMQLLNDAVLNLALQAKGFANYQSCEISATGEETFLKLLSRHNPQLCIDIGANQGDYSEALLNLTRGKVIAFEPLPQTYARLSRLQARFPNRFTAINRGVGDRNAELDLHFGDEDSTLATFSDEVNQIDYVGQSNTRSMKIEVVTLDSFLRDSTELESLPIDLLKIDTEGYEYEVLLGARETLDSRKPKFIQIEYNWHQLFKAQSLFKLASLLPNYVPYQLLPHGSALNQVDVRRPESNIYHYSNFVFVRQDIAAGI